MKGYLLLLISVLTMSVAAQRVVLKADKQKILIGEQFHLRVQANFYKGEALDFFEVDTIPGFVCTLNAAGEVELLNRQVLEYFGKTTEELKNWAMNDAVHPGDLPGVVDACRDPGECGRTC